MRQEALTWLTASSVSYTLSLAEKESWAALDNESRSRMNAVYVGYMPAQVRRLPVKPW